jgi:hypothetical protein
VGKGDTIIDSSVAANYEECAGRSRGMLIIRTAIAINLEKKHVLGNTLTGVMWTRY